MPRIATASGASGAPAATRAEFEGEAGRIAMESYTTDRPSRVVQVVAAITSLTSVVFCCLVVAELRLRDTGAPSGAELVFGCAYIFLPLGFMLFARHVTDEVWRWLRLLAVILALLDGMCVAAALWGLTVLPTELASLGLLITACAVTNMATPLILLTMSSRGQSVARVRKGARVDPAPPEESAGP